MVQWQCGVLVWSVGVVLGLVTDSVWSQAEVSCVAFGHPVVGHPFVRSASEGGGSISGFADLHLPTWHINAQPQHVNATQLIPAWLQRHQVRGLACDQCQQRLSLHALAEIMISTNISCIPPHQTAGSCQP
jgi:hypothetical protein